MGMSIDKRSSDGDAAGRPIHRVRIEYTEPVFQARLAGAPDRYSVEFFVPDAGSLEDAKRAAMREWEFCGKNSGVGWGRCVQSIRVDRTTEKTSGAWVIYCDDRHATSITGDTGNPAPRRRRGDRGGTRS